MKKTERQNGIVHLLRIRRKMTVNELANYFEVSERTIYRDIDALSQKKKKKKTLPFEMREIEDDILQILVGFNRARNFQINLIFLL
ncbi:DeoR family transcriptional regulator [Sedimentibacter sp.]|uniref:helix-turn-helix transcriptional regulator n=2 Tax=Sedimentibacter sp. TaxID=1960295 RepID=UPI0028B11313|nr:DeoR family transcriptional regulator [Sedimentibacter sp.]